jgi:glucose dehydrogenase
MKSSLGKAARMWSPPLYVQHLDTIFTTTSDPGSLFSDPNKDIQYSNSLVAINSKDLSVKYSWKMVNNDVWDFDSVGKPVLIKNFIHNNNNPQDVIVALSKIGFVYILNAATGKPLSDSQFGNQVFEHLNSENKVSSTQQRFPNWPARVSETSLTVNDMRPNMVKPNQLRHVKFGEFLSPSLDYDVVTRGLHGGPEWFGSRHFKIGGKNYLAVPYNNYAWILRAKYKIKETYQNENSNPPSQRWDLKSWFKNKKTDAVKKTHLPYLEHCASCHGENRQGYYQSEATGDGYVPSLLGYTLTKKYFYGRQIQNYKKMHTNSMVTQEILDDIFHHYEKKDRSDLAAGKLEKTGFWQIFRGIDGLPINHGPWGGVAVINLETGKLIHNIPVGHLEDNQGKQHTGSVIFGGLSNVDNEGRAMLTGTVNPKAYFLDLLNGKILNSLDLKRTASVGATSYLLNDQKYWVFTSSGGRFSFYKNQSVGHNIEVFRQN